MSANLTIRLLTPADREALLALIQQEPANNLFQIADLYQFGMEDPARLVYYGAFRGDQLVADMMRYRQNYAVYWPLGEPAPLAEFADIARRAGLRFCTGVPAQVEPFLAHFDPASIKKRFQQRYYHLPPGALAASDHHGARRAGRDDIDALAAFYARDFFADLGRTTTPEEHRQHAVNNLEAGQITYCIYEGERIISAAHTTALHRTLRVGAGVAMIGAVATLESHRNRGLSTSCMAALCADLLGRGIAPYLFWHDPAAGRVYDKVGFQDIGDWMIASFEETP
ncbi:MAG: GNAT family N-acetyltransferase [Chloroflexi bacterium]|nr:GNAT family N-acetyltransferase [Chloroflexota bacterium]MBU1747725.1 GNAT family N-acetyltransferase [Chloroflexota bacterium]